VRRIVTGLECGAIVHPSNLRSQVEGGTIMALGGALFEAIHFDGGRILNPRLSQYRVPRFRDVPPLEVILLDRPDLPSQGAGETPLIAVAPAIGNAIFDAIGERLRSLPMAPQGTLP
jgi:isoquinoline 1-oxidoreductase